MSTPRRVAARSAVIGAGVVGAPRLRCLVSFGGHETIGTQSSTELTGPAPVLEHHTVTLQRRDVDPRRRARGRSTLVLIHGLSLTTTCGVTSSSTSPTASKSYRTTFAGTGNRPSAPTASALTSRLQSGLYWSNSTSTDGVAGHSIGGTVLGQFFFFYPGVAGNASPGLASSTRSPRRSPARDGLGRRAAPHLPGSPHRLAARRRPGRTGTADGVSRSALTVRATTERRACPLHARTRSPD